MALSDVRASSVGFSVRIRPAFFALARSSASQRLLLLGRLAHLSQDEGLSKKLIGNVHYMAHVGTLSLG